ncbi:MAG: hypothetical protein ACFHWX_15530 [Bacteroidota bacterium]
MKQATLLVSFAILSTLFSCNKKQIEESNQFIIGTWEAISETLTGCDDPGMDTDGELVCSETSCVKYTFEEGGTYFAEITINGETFGEQGTFTLDVDKISLCVEDEGVVTCNGGSFNINSLNMSFTITDTDSGCSIFRYFEKLESDPAGA